MLEDLLDTPELGALFRRRLAIVIPYRDRAEHLAQLLPHFATYFSRDKLDRYLSVSFHVIEQSGTGLFNLGLVRNCGYLLTREDSDYTCFHDVYYLPIWADYSWTPTAARLVWHGLRLPEDPEFFFGAVNMFNNEVFEELNGFPTVYWGWGGEDQEMLKRCILTDLAVERRDGTFRALPHADRGYSKPGVMNDEGMRNLALFESRHENMLDLIKEDGLTTSDFKLLRKSPISLKGEVVPNAFHYLVDIGGPEGD